MGWDARTAARCKRHFDTMHSIAAFHYLNEYECEVSPDDSDFASC